MSRLGRNIGGTLFLNSLSTGLVLLANVVLARLLDVAGYGIYAYIVALVTLLAVGVVLGFDRLVTRELASRRSADEWQLLRGLVKRANGVVLSFALVVVLALAAVGFALAELRLTEATLALWIGLAALPFAALSRLRQSALVGLQQIVAGLVPETVIRPALLLLVPLPLALLLGDSFTAPVAVGVFSLATFAAFAVGSILFLRRRPSELRGGKPQFATRSWLRTGFELGLVGAVGILVGQVDLLIVGALQGAEAAGLYAVAWRGAALIAFGLLAVNAPVSAAVARLWSAGDHEALQAVVTRSSRVVVTIAIPLAILFIVFGDVFLEIFGPAFVAAHSVLAILAVGQLINAAAGPVGVLLVMTGHHRVAALGMATGAATIVIAALVLIPPFGIVGAALAAAIGTSVWNLLLARWVLRILGVHPTALGVIRLGRA